jgi:hypothetical protein
VWNGQPLPADAFRKKKGPGALGRGIVEVRFRMGSARVWYRCDMLGGSLRICGWILSRPVNGCCIRDDGPFGGGRAEDATWIHQGCLLGLAWDQVVGGDYASAAVLEIIHVAGYAGRAGGSRSTCGGCGQRQHRIVNAGAGVIEFGQVEEEGILGVEERVHHGFPGG